MPGVPVTCGDDTRVLPTHCTRGCGCDGHPAFPTPSDFRGERFLHDSDASRREIADLYLGHVGAGPERTAPEWRRFDPGDMILSRHTGMTGITRDRRPRIIEPV